MRRVPVTEAKDRPSELLRLVKRGETVEILERGTPIARIEAVSAASPGQAHLDRLVREGIVTRARRKPSRRLVDLPPITSRADPVRALTEERGDR